MKRSLTVWGLFLAAVLCLTAGPAQAYDLLGGDLVIHGKFSEQWNFRARNTRDWEEYDYRTYNARTSLKLETMYHAYKGPEYQINLYGTWKEFYDMADHVDGEYKRMLEDSAGGTDKTRQEARNFNTFKDICRELYAELNGPMFQVRLGKQIVSWGETSFARMVDNINPTDLRMDMNPAYPDFGELKQGLWMGRFFFTPPDQPMDLTYELLLIPDFEPNILWPGGTHLMHPRAQNNMKNGNEIYEAYYRDAPDDSWHKMEWGVRIRGFVWGFDWTLSYFRSRVDDGVQGPNTALKSGVGPLLGNTRLTRRLGWFPLKNTYKYPFYDLFGFTFNRPIDMTIPIIPGTSLAMSGNILRLEATWEHNKPGFQVEGLGGLKSSIDKQNRYAFCASWATKIFLPYVTPYFRNKYLSATTQVICEFMPEKHRTDWYYPYVTYGKKRKAWTSVTQELSYEMWNGRILPGFYGCWYATEGGGYWAPAIGFKPQYGHTFMLRFLAYSHLDDQASGLNSKDSILIDYTYEF